MVLTKNYYYGFHLFFFRVEILRSFLFAIECYKLPLEIYLRPLATLRFRGIFIVLIYSSYSAF